MRRIDPQTGEVLESLECRQASTFQGSNPMALTSSSAAEERRGRSEPSADPGAAQQGAMTLTSQSTVEQVVGPALQTTLSSRSSAAARSQFLQIAGGPCVLRRAIESAVDLCRMNKVLAQVRNILDKLRIVPHGHMIEQHQMLVNLAHVSYCGTTGKLNFWLKDYRQKLADAGQPRAICLHIMHGAGLDEVFEHHSIRNVPPVAIFTGAISRASVTCAITSSG